MSTHNLYSEEKHEKYQKFLSKKLSFFGGKNFSVYLNRRGFVIRRLFCYCKWTTKIHFGTHNLMNNFL